MSTLISYLPLFSGRARVITHVTGWLLVFFTFFYLISGIRSTGEAFARTMVNLVFMMSLFYGNARYIVNRYVETGQFFRNWWKLVLLWLGAAALRTWMESAVFGGSLFNLDLPANSIQWRVFGGYTLSFFLLLIFSTLYQLAENRRALEVRHLELEARHSVAQLNYLKAQINPHFLFNTLNNIYAAAILQHPRTADMVLRLSELLRYVTYDAQADQVPLEKEIGQIRAYIDLFQLKSEHPLPIIFTVEGNLSGRNIEPVLLLPLVENALKHGDLEENPRAFLHILLQTEPNGLRFSVENSFNPDDLQKDEAGGVGLENVRGRLALHYPGRYKFEAGAANRVYRSVIELN